MTINEYWVTLAKNVPTWSRETPLKWIDVVRRKLDQMTQNGHKNS